MWSCLAPPSELKPMVTDELVPLLATGEKTLLTRLALLWNRGKPAGNRSSRCD